MGPKKKWWGKQGHNDNASAPFMGIKVRNLWKRTRIFQLRVLVLYLGRTAEVFRGQNGTKMGRLCLQYEEMLPQPKYFLMTIARAKSAI